MAHNYFSTAVQLLLATTLFAGHTIGASSLRHAHLHHSRHSHLSKRETAAPTGWEYKGCYSDDANSRTLYDATTSNNNMTVASCVSYCRTAGYPFAGVEYSSECYCGRVISASGKITTNVDDCSMKCTGDPSQICGGNSRISVYHDKSDTATAQSPAINAGPSGWGYLGCYVDSQNTRTLPYGATTIGGVANMTVANCAIECQRQSYKYAGVEYSGECFCGSTLSASALASDGEVGCNRVCNGNTTEYCGGANRLNVYGYGMRSTIAPLWNPIGCYSDSTASRSLRYGAEVPGGYTNMTIPGCTAACQNGGYKLAGLEYSQECFCDNSIQSPGASATSGCDMACKGDRNTICGGNARLNIYAYDGYAASTTSTTSSSISTTSSTNATSSTVSTLASTTTLGKPTATAYSGNWTYQGCYIDNQYGRILSQFAASPDNTTIDSCISTCNSTGYGVAGVEYGYQCFCGKAIINGASLAPETDCSMPCGGNANQKCGNGNRMSIYSAAKNVTIYKVPTTLTTGLPNNFTYKGCLAELAGGRAFSRMVIDAVNNTVPGCLQRCSDFGYSAAGLQYGEQCFCGDDSDRINSGVQYIANSTCSMSCPGDTESLCGGPNAFSYYTSPNIPTFAQGVGNSAGKYDMLIGGLVIPLIVQIGVNGKVVMTEKYGTGPANSTGAYELDISQVPNMNKAWREMHGLKTDVFCSAGLTLPDKGGRLINLGGWSGDSTFGVRLYWPDGSDGVNGTRDWEENKATLSLQAGRWYPTALQLVNGSILVIGGQEGSNGAPVPSSEVVPKPPGGYLVQHEWLRTSDPYNLYPFLCVLPSGNLAAFYYNEARILDAKTFQTLRTLPNIPGYVGNPASGRTYPLEGTAMLLPQTAPYSAPLKVIICGGSTPFQGYALDNCVTITPDVAGAKWELERMPDKRVMTCMAALPDGTYLILNGARQGEAGFGLATDPAYMAMLYNPTKPFNQRFTRMANTTIERLYHSEATLLLDGRVLVSGSDPEDNIHPQEYRLETFTPPYLMGNLAASRPAYNITNKDWAYGKSYTITITKGSVAKISLLAAVASTHGNSMGQRTLFPAFSCSGSTCTITAPPNGNVAGGPGWWMLFALNAAGTPSVAQWVRIGGDPAGLGNWPAQPGFTLPGV